MKPLPRKAKTAAKPVQHVDLSKLENKPPTGDFFKDTQIESDLEPESDYSDYGRPTKKRKSKAKTKSTPMAKKQKTVREPSPDVPEMSDLDDDDEHEEDYRLFDPKKRLMATNVKATVLPKVLRLEIRSAPTTININLADFFRLPNSTSAGAASTNMDGNTLLDAAEGCNVRDQDSAYSPDNLSRARLNPKYACFLELEPELRNRVYRELLVTGTVVKFNPAPRLSRTAAILRTCRQIHEEARGILYGDNAFHFDRTDKPRGKFLDEEWKEVGYKDVRRFLETIGADNVAKLRFVSLHLSDAAPIFTPKLDAMERRYCNDPVLHHVLRLIGRSGCVLEKFVVAFTGRSTLDTSDVPFIRAFTSITCRQLIKTCRWGHSRVESRLLSDMEDFMEKPNFGVDEKRQKVPIMEHES